MKTRIAFLLLLTLLVVAPVEAVAQTAPPAASIVSPTDGATFYEVDGPVHVEVSFVSETPENFQVEYLRNGSQVALDEVSFDPVAPTIYADDSIVDQAGGWVIRVLHPASGSQLDAVQVTVIEQFDVLSRGVTLTKFYPTVRDGYRDVTKMLWGQNRTATVKVKVRRLASGSSVRSERLGRTGAGRHSWTWNGRDRRGDIVPTGYYRITVKGRTANGEREKAAETVRVARKRIVTVKRLHKDAHQSSARDKTGNCNFGGFAGDVLLTCLNGSAWLTFSWPVPAKADVTQYGFSTSAGVWPCLNTSKSITRAGGTARTTFRMTSSGYRGRQCWVEGASLRYRTVRII